MQKDFFLSGKMLTDSDNFYVNNHLLLYSCAFNFLKL